MGERVGFGASVAAAILFSTLLFSNFVVLIGAGQREGLSAQSDEESYLADNAFVIGGAQGLSLLDAVQGRLSSEPFVCDGFTMEVAHRLDNLTSSLIVGPLTINASLSIGMTRAIEIGPSALQPFNGTGGGMLNFVLSVSERADIQAFGVSINETTVSPLNLPVKMVAIADACREYETTVTATLQGTPFSGCNATEIYNTMLRVGDSLSENSTSVGLQSRLTFSVDRTHGCQVDFTLTVSQASINGPLGPFTVSAEEEAAVDLPD